MESPRPQDVEEALASKLADSAVFVAVGPAVSVPTRGPAATTEDVEPSHTIASEPLDVTKHVASSTAALLSPHIEGSPSPRSSLLGQAHVLGAELLVPSPDAKVEDVAASHIAVASSMSPCSDSVLAPRSCHEGRRISWSQIAVHTDDAWNALALPC